jgi:hypothetical protein
MVEAQREMLSREKNIEKTLKKKSERRGEGGEDQRSCRPFGVIPIYLLSSS